MHRLCLKEIHLLILKHLVEGQGPVGTLFADGGTGRHRFCSPGVLPLLWQMYTVHLRDATLLPASGGRGACVIGSHKGVTIRETVFGRLPPPGHCTDTRLRHNPHSFCEKGLLSWSFRLWGRLQICHKSGGYGRPY